jgi:hypothetical protein
MIAIFFSTALDRLEAGVDVRSLQLRERPFLFTDLTASSVCRYEIIGEPIRRPSASTAGAGARVKSLLE